MAVVLGVNAMQQSASGFAVTVRVCWLGLRWTNVGAVFFHSFIKYTVRTHAITLSRRYYNIGILCSLISHPTRASHRRTAYIIGAVSLSAWAL